MSLVNILPWIRRAQEEGWAVGAFNANTLEQVQAIAAGAEAECAPALIQISHRALLHVGGGNALLGLRYMSEIGKVAAQSVRAPIGLHLDHADADEVLVAMGLGFTSVMFDGGELPFEANVAETQRLRAISRGLDICLEAEIGAVPRVDASGRLDEAVALTDVSEATAFVAATGVDTLAIALGSVHAVRSKSVSLDLDRLREIRAAIDVPLVLHGSSGVTDEHIRQGIALGLCKVNVATQLVQAFTGAVRGVLAEPNEIDPRRYLAPARAAMTERVRERIRMVGAAGKA